MSNIVIKPDIEDNLTFHGYMIAESSNRKYYAFSIFKDVLFDILGKEDFYKVDNIIKNKKYAILKLEVL